MVVLSEGSNLGKTREDYFFVKTMTNIGVWGS